MDIPFSKVLDALQDLSEQIQREANQSILKRDHCQGLAALGGLDALERLESRLRLSLGAASSALGVSRVPRSKVRPLRGRVG